MSEKYRQNGADIVVWVEEKLAKSITEEAAKAVLDAAKRRAR